MLLVKSMFSSLFLFCLIFGVFVRNSLCLEGVHCYNKKFRVGGNLVNPVEYNGYFYQYCYVEDDEVGHVMSINSAEEQRFLVGAIKNGTIDNLSGYKKQYKTKLWISLGLNSFRTLEESLVGKLRVFEWSDGSSYVYSSFGGSQPTLRSEETVFQIRSGYDYFWGDNEDVWDNSRYYAFICKHPICHSQSECDLLNENPYNNVVYYSRSAECNLELFNCPTAYQFCHGYHMDSAKVCSGNQAGKCASYNKCVCNSHFGGLRCDEVCRFAYLHPKENLLEMEYIVPPLYIHQILSPVLNCSYLLFHNDVQLGTNYECELGNGTLKVLLGGDHEVEANQLVHIQSITVPGTFFSVQIQLEKKISLLTFFSDFYYVIIIIFVFVVLAMMLMVALFVCLIVFFVKKSIRLRRFENVEGLDIIVQEIELDSKKQRNSINSVAKVSVNQDMLTIDYSEITLLSELAQGGSGSVIYKCLWGQKICAFKSFKYQNFIDNEFDVEEFEKEICFAFSLNFPSIIKYYGITNRPPKLGILMEYCEKGSFESYLKMRKMNKKPASFPLKIRLLLESADAIKFLHSKGIIHRDIKPQNILLTKKLQAKVSDFGLSRIIDSATNQKTMTRNVGTVDFMAPEVFSNTRYDTKVDSFSFAVMIFAVVEENFNPFGGYQGSRGFKGSQFLINDPNNRPSFKSQHPKWITSLVEEGWKHSPSERPDMIEIHSTLDTEYLKMDASKKGVGEHEEVDERDEVIDRLKNEVERLKRLLKESNVDY